MAKAFCIAEIHGSIVQTEITRDRLISIYSMLCSLFNNHSFIVEYVRLLVINRDCKRIDTLIRNNNHLVGSLNDSDVVFIVDSIVNIADSNHKMMSKYLLASRLGYYLSDENIADSYTVLQTLKVIISYLEDTNKETINDQTILAFLSFSILMTQNIENDIKHNATCCLVELTNYKIVRRVALMQLSKIMDYGAQAEKIAVLSRIGKIRSDEDDYVVQIINKGKSDNNYLVRYIATRAADHGKESIDT